MDVGRYEGVAPSMWAFPAGFWRMSGSCAIYVPKRQLDVEKKYGGKPAQKITKNWYFFRDIEGATPTHSPKSGCKCPHRWRNSFYTIQICAISPYIQAKMIGNVIN